MTKIEQLKAQVKQIAEANAAKVKEAAEVARLEATIKLESSPALLDAKVRLMSSQQQTEKLQQLVDECEQIVASVPVFNSKTRQNRVWAGGHRYGYGTQVDLMYQLASGILYSCQEHKQLLVAHTGLDTELLEQVVNAFGSPSYYNRNYHTVVEPKAYDLGLLESALAVLQSNLGVVADVSQINQTRLDAEFARAEVTAQNNFEMAKEAVAQADFSL